ncbi:MAG TPA: amidohydrolase family protein, partial [Thermomicrobiales bacterium]|nr:amidohydrolase family protein [Thermomicrobiales bacterium]
MSFEQPVHRIDSHHHVWDPTRRDYPWMEGLDAIHKPFTVDDLKPLLDANGFDGSVLVQTVSDLDETREFLTLADQTPFILGVVGWADLTKLDLAADIEELRSGAGGEYLVGIRHQVHDEDDADWLLQEEVQRGLEALAEANLVYDLLVRPRELPAAITVARDFPHLKFVVDHIAKPPIASGELEPWVEQMHEFAGLDNVACKLSGMVTEANADGWTVDDLVPYVRTVVEIFGHDRLMFGSDWPVCLLAASYDEVVAAARQALERIDALTPEAD